MEIRKLEKSDQEQFWPVRQRGLKEDPQAFGASYEESLKMTSDEIARRMQNTADGFVLGAFTGKKLVGVVGFIRGPGIKTRHKGYIWGMYVVPESRGHGAAKKLMQSLIALCSALADFEQLTLSVVTTNLTAARLYQSLGFKTYGRDNAALKIDGEYFDEDLMYLELKDLK